MAKKKFYEKKVHSNRYLIWTLSMVVVITTALVSYIEISGINMGAELVNIQVQQISVHELNRK